MLAAQYLVKASRGDIGQQANAGAVGKDFTPYLALGASTDPVAGTSVEGFKNALRLDFYAANNHLLPGSGLGVSANGNSSVNGDTSQISAYLSEVMYDKVALDISGSGGDERVFT